uniref:Uncharacterized protein n=1 Tax=Syphacia muris TaxID=451379 RepID=A0A0N5AER0_9BILA
MESAFSEFSIQSSTSSMVIRAFVNGFCATLVFLVFLFFLARYIRKHEKAKEVPQAVVVQPSLPSPCPYNKPPPTYEVNDFISNFMEYFGFSMRNIISFSCKGNC